MTRFVSPPVESFDKLRQPLTKGERMVFDFFDQNLALEWEIYIQPHMNGLRPDFVLIHPNAGIAVFEVKDWNLDSMNYWLEERTGKSPRLLGSRDGKTFSLQNQNPIEKIHQYKEEIFGLYCPRLAKQLGYAVITAGVIFPFADDKRVQTLFEKSLKYRGMLKYPKYSPVSGRNAIAAGELNAIFPEGKRTGSKYMKPAMADDLRFWLREPDFSAEQRQPLQLDSAQRALATSRSSSGYRRIKGSAGSGKSLVLAARAAELVYQGKEVLVVTFNITLLHYLMDASVRWERASGQTRKRITWLNFHWWCRRVCKSADLLEEYKQLWSGSDPKKVLKEDLAHLISRILDSDQDELVTRYDAVLVDEGQDFELLWWDCLRKVCKPGGEMLLVADATQDIYETANAWTDEAMTGAGFSGPWSSLEISYRMPRAALDQARRFASTFLPQTNINLPSNKQASLELETTNLRWVQTTQELAVNICRDELLQLFRGEMLDDLSIPDTTFLCMHKNFGLEVVKSLDEFGIKVIHTFDADEQESRRQKVGFYMGDARVKATTLHSFKGWESRLLVIFINSSASQKDMALIYTGLTRLKNHPQGSALTVVSASEELRDYGQGWPDYEERLTAAR